MRIVQTPCAITAVFSLAMGCATAWIAPSLTFAQDSKLNAKTEVNAKGEAVVSKGVEYLAKHGQAADGSFSAKAGPGVSALVLTSLLRNNRNLDDPTVSKGLKALEAFVKPDGGIYGSGRLKNYETCVSMLCFSAANKNGKYTTILNRAKSFVTDIQIAVATDSPEELWNGGSTYGGQGRPDLSNTSYLIEALRAEDASADDPAIQRALVFVSRCQNLVNEHNKTPFADKVNDGGFYYEIPLEKIDPSTSEEKFAPNGGLRSYGSMTYSGLKSMVYAGLTKEDKRVQAAVEWIQKHYAVDANPGMGDAGLFYYYNTFAAALDTAGLDTVKGNDGKIHDWRAELIDELAKRQNEDGSWSNNNSRWLENDKNLSTAFALMALSYCRKPLKSDSP